MRFKSMLAVVVGLGMIGLGIWRLTTGETTMGIVVGLIGAVLLFRGATGTVRQGF